MSQDMFEAKKNFVERELTRCMAAAHDGLHKLEYELRETGGNMMDEVVILRFFGGYCKRISVVGDSLHAIALDVLRALD